MRGIFTKNFYSKKTIKFYPFDPHFVLSIQEWLKTRLMGLGIWSILIL